jgi:hypothetical protein
VNTFIQSIWAVILTYNAERLPASSLVDKLNRQVGLIEVVDNNSFFEGINFTGETAASRQVKVKAFQNS